jgi:hypothetical protein
MTDRSDRDSLNLNSISGFEPAARMRRESADLIGASDNIAYKAAYRTATFLVYA